MLMLMSLVETPLNISDASNLSRYIFHKQVFVQYWTGVISFFIV